MPIVEVKELVKKYKMGNYEVEALRGVNLEINEGEFVSIAGPSGSGKTTLLNLIGCLDLPTNGRVLIDNEDVSSLSIRKLSHLRRDKIGFIFQFFNLLPILSAFENVEYPLLLKNINKKERKKRVTAVLEQVGLKEYMKHRPNELSGGQQQRVAIARALVADPVIILADEPTGNLDSKTADEIIDLMMQLNKTRQMTFLISTHDPKVMEKVGRLIKIRDGQISEA